MENSLKVIKGPSIELFIKLYQSEDWRKGVIRFQLSNDITLIVQVRTYVTDSDGISFTGWICTEVQTNFVKVDEHGNSTPDYVVIETNQEIDGYYWPNQQKLDYTLTG